MSLYPYWLLRLFVCLPCLASFGEWHSHCDGYGLFDTIRTTFLALEFCSLIGFFFFFFLGGGGGKFGVFCLLFCFALLCFLSCFLLFCLSVCLFVWCCFGWKKFLVYCLTLCLCGFVGSFIIRFWVERLELFSVPEFAARGSIVEYLGHWQSCWSADCFCHCD